jgi:hypothetical protein
MAGTLAVKLFLILRFRGFLTGDDLEVVQSAARFAIGFDYRPWDIRCLFHPIVFVAPFVRAAALAGTRDPAALTAAAAIPAALFSTAAIGGVFALALRFGAPRSSAVAAAWLYGLHPLPLAYGATAFPRPVSAAMLVAAFLLAGEPRRRSGLLVAAGAVAGAAFAVRWSEGVVLIPLVLWSVGKDRAIRSGLLVLAGFAAAALVCAGLFDLATYGGLFHSLGAFFREMYLEISPERLGHEAPFGEYFRTVLRWGGPVLVLLSLASGAVRAARAPLAIGASIVLLLSFFAHKEERYLQSAIPFFAVSAACGWEWLRVRGHRVLAAVALAAALPWGIARAVSLHRHRSASEIEAARVLRDLVPRPRVLALEQTWAYGEHFYLGGGNEIRDVEYRSPVRPRAIADAARDADVVGLYALHLDRAALEELKRLGFRRARSVRVGPDYECALFTRRAPPDR